MFGFGNKQNNNPVNEPFVIEYNALDPKSATQGPILFAPKPETLEKPAEPPTKPARISNTVFPKSEPTPQPGPPESSLSSLESVLAKNDGSMTSKPEKPHILKTQSKRAAMPAPTPAPSPAHSSASSQKSAMPLYPIPTKGPLAIGTGKSSLSGLPQTTHSKSSYSKGLLFFAILIMLVTVGAGAYYYLYILNPGLISSEPVGNEPTPPSTITGEPVNNMAKSLDDPETIIVQSGESVLIPLKKQAEAVKQSPDTLDKTFYTFKNEASQPLVADDIINGMDLRLKSISADLSNAWVYLQLDSDQHVKLCLIYELKNPIGMQEKIKEMEPTLLDLVRNMYIDDQIQLPSKANFADSDFDPRVRYINLSQTNSLDWWIAKSDDNKTYLLMATSRETMKSLLTKL